MAAVTTSGEELQLVLAAYDLEAIFNLDEMSLFYRCGPNSALATSNVKGKKWSKDRIHVALTANATGSIKINLFVIEKVARHRCFWKTYNPDRYVHYWFNKKALMTFVLFQDWLKDFTIRLRRLVGRSSLL